jgi:hypothetical protein
MNRIEVHDVSAERSSVVETLGYDRQEQTLYVRFRGNGSVWCYKQVRASVFRHLLSVESMGRFVSLTIKKEYDAAEVAIEDWQSLLDLAIRSSREALDEAYQRENGELFDALRRSGRSIGF